MSVTDVNLDSSRVVALLSELSSVGALDRQSLQASGVSHVLSAAEHGGHVVVTVREPHERQCVVLGVKGIHVLITEDGVDQVSSHHDVCEVVLLLAGSQLVSGKSQGMVAQCVTEQVDVITTGNVLCDFVYLSPVSAFNVGVRGPRITSGLNGPAHYLCVKVNVLRYLNRRRCFAADPDMENFVSLGHDFDVTYGVHLDVRKVAEDDVCVKRDVTSEEECEKRKVDGKGVHDYHSCNCTVVETSVCQ